MDNKALCGMRLLCSKISDSSRGSFAREIAKRRAPPPVLLRRVVHPPVDPVPGLRDDAGSSSSVDVPVTVPRDSLSPMTPGIFQVCSIPILGFATPPKSHSHGSYVDGGVVNRSMGEGFKNSKRFETKTDDCLDKISGSSL